MNYKNVIVVSHEDAKLPKLGPDFDHVAGIRKRDTDHDTFWHTVIEKLGGTERLKDVVPFDKNTLITAYAQDEYFNTPKTNLRIWDKAGGWKQGYQGKMLRTGSPLQDFLLKHGIRSYSPSDCVCLLKQVAKQMMEEQNAKDA